MKYNGLKQLSQELGFEVFSRSSLPNVEDVPNINSEELVDLGMQITKIHGIEALLLTLSHYMNHRLDIFNKELDEASNSSKTQDEKEYEYCEIMGRKKELGELVTMLDEIVRKITD